MSVAIAARSAVLAAYLVALASGGSADPLAYLTALAVVALWIASLLRDRHRRGAAADPSAPAQRDGSLVAGGAAQAAN